MGGALVLTHFCGAGNQPRMRATRIDDGGRQVAFEMYDITNLSDPQAYHTTSLDCASSATGRWSWRSGARRRESGARRPSIS
jgi:hypothetical protein